VKVILILDSLIFNYFETLHGYYVVGGYAQYIVLVVGTEIERRILYIISLVLCHCLPVTKDLRTGT